MTSSQNVDQSTVQIILEHEQPRKSLIKEFYDLI